MGEACSFRTRTLRQVERLQGNTSMILAFRGGYLETSLEGLAGSCPDSGAPRLTDQRRTPPREGDTTPPPDGVTASCTSPLPARPAAWIALGEESEEPSL